MRISPISSPKRHIIAYDADCGPCTRFRHLVDLLDLYNRIDFVSIPNADQKGLLDSVATDLRYTSFHLILPNGQVKSGSDGVLELISILPGGSIAYPLVLHFPGAERLLRLVYRRLSRLHNNGSCDGESKSSAKNV